MDQPSVSNSDAKEAKEEDDMNLIIKNNPDSFLHIFNYSQNTEVKEYSTIETTGDKVSLCLRAPDAEVFARLNHEIDQIERMRVGFCLSERSGREPQDLLRRPRRAGTLRLRFGLETGGPERHDEPQDPDFDKEDQELRGRHEDRR